MAAHEERRVGRVRGARRAPRARPSRAAGGSFRSAALRCPFVAGHTCPSGSIGLPQNWQRGRPRATTASPWRASASICSRLAHSVTDSGSLDRAATADRPRPRARGRTRRSRAGTGPRRRRSRSTSVPRGTAGRRGSSSVCASSSTSAIAVSIGASARSSSTDRASSSTCSFSTTTVTQLLAGPGLQVERAHPGLADRVGGDAVDLPQVHAGYPRTFVPRRSRPAASHGGVGAGAEPRRARPCRSPAARADAGHPARTTETPAVSITIRWNASRGAAGEVRDRDPDDVAVRRDHDGAAAMPTGDPFDRRRRRAPGRRGTPRRRRETRTRSGIAAPCRHAFAPSHLAERAARPRAGVHLDERLVGARTSSRRASASGSTVCTQRSSGLL